MIPLFEFLFIQSAPQVCARINDHSFSFVESFLTAFVVNIFYSLTEKCLQIVVIRNVVLTGAAKITAWAASTAGRTVQLCDNRVGDTL